jgi:hypothetical protein
MSRTYGDGRAAMRAARKDPSTEALHDWRKRVKDLWYEERLITAAWPPLLEASSSELKVLSELLGDDHDLAVLAEHLPELPPGLEDLPEIIDARRGELQDEAFRLGARIYAEAPKAYTARVGALLAVARHEARAEAAAP